MNWTARRSPMLTVSGWRALRTSATPERRYFGSASMMTVEPPTRAPGPKAAPFSSESTKTVGAQCAASRRGWPTLRLAPTVNVRRGWSPACDGIPSAPGAARPRRLGSHCRPSGSHIRPRRVGVRETGHFNRNTLGLDTEARCVIELGSRASKHLLNWTVSPQFTRKACPPSGRWADRERDMSIRVPGQEDRQASCGGA